MSAPEVTRRAALGLVLAGLATGGCEVADPARPPADGGSDPSTPPADSPAADPDAALVDSVRGELATALALVMVTADRPALAAETAPFRRLHRRHLAALPGDEVTASPARVPGDTQRARSRVSRHEQRLQGSLADAAVRAESGPLAALLASMSAAVAQQLATGGVDPS